MKKITLLFIGILAIALGLWLGISSFSINDWVKAAIERGGPLMTKTTVTVQKVNLSASTGSGSLEGLLIGNPEGFKTPSSISAGKIDLSIDPKSVLSDVIVIHHLILVAPEITYETTFSESNLSQIQKNLSTVASTGSRTQSSKKIILEKVRIQSGKIRISHEVAAGQSVASPLPDIELTDIGKSAGGISPENAFGEILKAVIVSTAKSADPSKAIDAIKGFFQ